MARPGDEARSRILRERARLLAQSAGDLASGPSLELLVFDLAQECYAVETRYVREVHPLKHLTPVPCTPRFFLGIINVRGEMCPVIDLKRLFGMAERGLTNATRAVILRDGALEIGVVADTVAGVRTLALSAVLDPPEALAGTQDGFLRGVAAEGLIVLDAVRLLAHPSMTVREEVGDLR